MKRRSFLKSSLALATTSGLPSLSQAATSLPSVLMHRVDDRSAPIVYFIKVFPDKTSSEPMML